MAQQTQLSTSATPGRVQAFSAKSPSAGAAAVYEVDLIVQPYVTLTLNIDPAMTVTLDIEAVESVDLEIEP